MPGSGDSAGRRRVPNITNAGGARQPITDRPPVGRDEGRENAVSVALAGVERIDGPDCLRSDARSGIPPFSYDVV